MFESAGAIIDPALSTTDALEATLLHPYDLIISDWARPEGEDAGPDFLKALRADSNCTPVVFMPDTWKADNAARRLDSPTAPTNSYTSSLTHFRQSVVGINAE